MVDLVPPPPAVKAEARDFRVWGAASTGPKHPSVTKFEALDTDLDVLIEEDRREVRQYPDFQRGEGETWRHFGHRMCIEGHTFFDAWLLMAGAIGQVMLTTPNAWYKMGLIPGAIMIVWGTLVGIWTIIQFKAMYDDRKRDLIVEGEWYDDPSKPHNRRHKTQNQEMLGYYLGVWGIRVVAFMQFFGWFGTGAKQILSSSSLFYSINQSWSMRSWTILSGFLLLPFGLIPNFRKARVILIVGVAGTMFCGLYGIIISGQKGFADAKYANLWPQKGKEILIQPFFNGAAVLFSILDHNSIVAETIEAMQYPRKFFKVYVWGFWPLVFMVVPPGLALNLAYARTLGAASNFFQLAPMNLKVAAVVLMFLHNIQAYTLWMTAFGFMWEKIVGTHDKALWIRLGSRVPALLLIFLFCLAAPFYEVVNSFMNGIFSPLLTYTLPCGIFWLHYRKEEHRKKISYPHMRRVIEIFTWKGVAAINLALVMYGLVLVGFTSAMGVIQLVKLRQEASGLFPECFSCEQYVKG